MKEDLDEIEPFKEEEIQENDHDDITNMKEKKSRQDEQKLNNAELDDIIKNVFLKISDYFS